MAVKIRLSRHGKKGYAFYHIVVADSRAPRDGKFIEKLGTYIDVLQIHRLDRSVPPKEIMKALNDVIEKGWVRYIGASSMAAWEFQTLQNIAEITVIILHTANQVSMTGTRFCYNAFHFSFFFSVFLQFFPPKRSISF